MPGQPKVVDHEYYGTRFKAWENCTKPPEQTHELVGIIAGGEVPSVCVVPARSKRPNRRNVQTHAQKTRKNAGRCP